jgi:hypothetical protein
MSRACRGQVPLQEQPGNYAVHQLFIVFRKAYDLVRREVLYVYNILIEFGIPMKLLKIIKMCLNETYTRVQESKHLSDMFFIRNGLKQGDASSPLFFSCAIEYTIRRVRINQDGLKLNGAHQVSVYDNDVNVLGRHIHAVKKCRSYSSC